MATTEWAISCRNTPHKEEEGDEHTQEVWHDALGDEGRVNRLGKTEHLFNEGHGQFNLGSDDEAKIGMIKKKV